MKTKFSINRLAPAFASVLLCLVFLCGCQSRENYKQPTYEDGYKIAEIDSCEYITTPVYMGEVLTHKGNCKFCRASGKKH